MSPVTLRDIHAAIPYVDDDDAFVKAQTDAALRYAMELCRPPNWHGTGASHDLLAAAQHEGLPLAWVPPPDIVGQLRFADSTQSREAVLLEERTAILEACASVIDECNAPEIAAPRMLIAKSIAALRDDHDEAGMALAVSVGEGLAHWAVQPRVRAFESRGDRDQWDTVWKKHNRYKRIDLVKTPAGEVEPQDFVHQVLIAPITHFFAEFRAGDLKPSVLNRHVVAHDPTPDHMSRVNALKSVMLVTGILRAQQDWITQIAETDGFEGEVLTTERGPTFRPRVTSQQSIRSCGLWQPFLKWLESAVGRRRR